MADISVIIEVLGNKEIERATKSMSSLEGRVGTLRKAFNEGRITNDQYNQGLKEIRRSVDNQFPSWQKAKSAIDGHVKALDQLEKSRAVERHTKETERLKLQYNTTYRAAQSFKTQLGELNEAQRRGALSADMHERQVRELKNEYRQFLRNGGGPMNQFGQLASRNTRVMKRFGAVGMQQVGYQVQDFAVQVQSGTSAMVALGQQGSQLLGIFGPYGAIAGMILAIGTGLAGAFMATKDAADKATNSIMSLKEAQDALNESAASYRSRLDQLRFGVDSEAEAETLKEMLRLREEYADIQQRYENTDSLRTRQRLAEEAVEIRTKLSLLREEAEAHREVREAFERESYTQEMVSLFRQAQQRIRQENGETMQAELEAARRTEAAYAEYYRSRRTGASIAAREELEAQERVESAFKQYQQSRIAGENAMRRAGSLTAEQLMRSIPLLESMTTLDTSGTVNQINMITRALRISTAQAIQLARSLPGYTSGGVSGPDGAVAQSQELLGQGTVVTPTLDFSDLDNGSGGGSAGSISQTTQAIEELNKQLSKSEQLMLDVGKTVAESFGDALMSIVDGSKSAADAFKDMARQILKQAFDMMVIKPLMNSIMGFFSPGLGMSTGAANSIVSQLPSALLGQANGGAWNNGVQMYANGGVVGSPTAFRHSGGLGVMGEAGPEAIMPLKRGKNGKLGVQVEGGSGNVTVENHFHISANGDDSVKRIIQQEAPKIASYTQQQILDQRRRGGAMKQTFG